MINKAQEFQNIQIINLLVKPRYRYLRHTIFILFFLCLLLFADYLKAEKEPYRYERLSTVFVMYILLFYFNMYILVPIYFFKAKYLYYCISLLCLVCVGLLGLGGIFNLFYTVGEPKAKTTYAGDIYGGVLISLSFILITTTIKLLQRWTKDNQRISELKNLTLSMELNELKNQINPHFLFNMLNNVKALIRTNPEMAVGVIMQLSEFLRYQLYENTAETTALSSEIEFISHFLNLECLRKDHLDIIIDNQIDAISISKIHVPPNLFTPFVENAIKHSADPNSETSYIHISFRLLPNNRLLFSCINSVPSFYNQRIHNKNSGLGLVNIKRRLDLLYKNQYQLQTENTENTYSTYLNLPL